MPDVTPSPPASPFARWRKISLNIILFVLLCAALAAAGYFYWQAKKQGSPVPGVTEEEEISTLTQQLGAVIELPADEKPTLATVTDREKLAGQPFFEKAENGDKVLIYSQSGKAILYRPSTKKIIEMTSVNIEQAAQNAPVPEPASSSAPVADSDGSETAAPVFDTPISVLNGGASKGSAKVLGEALKKAGYTSITATNAEKDYVGTTIYYASGSEKEAEHLKGIVSQTHPGVTITAALKDDPETQTTPLTIILGK